jgi:hypothetical protein
LGKPQFINRKYIIPLMIAAVFLSMLLQIVLTKRPAPPERRFQTPENSNEIMTLSFEDIIFQDSRIITVKLIAIKSPVRFDISLESKNGNALLPVYSSTVPFDRNEDGKKIDFFLGEHPPNPLAFEIVLPLEFEGILEARAVYNKWDPMVDNDVEPDSEDYILMVSQRTAL